jgi:hypothetical protein
MPRPGRHVGPRRPSQEARAAQLQLGLDLASVNADGTLTRPMPATVILDATRNARWIDVHPTTAPAPNLLFFRENPHMLFDDARDRVEDIFKAI